MSGNVAGGAEAIVGATDAYLFHEWTSSADLLPYLRPGWRELLATYPARDAGPAPLLINPMGTKIESTYPAKGTVGLEFDIFKEQVLDARAPGRVVLGYDESVLMTASANVRAAAEIIRAINEWTIDAWLARDPRLYGVILISGAAPELAAKEIRRLGQNERMVAVAMGANVLNLTFGHAAYHPIYEAASELGLPVVIQVGSDLPATLLTPPVAGGHAATYGEYLALNMHPLMSHAAAMIINGMFEQFPDLKVLLVGGGVTWVPGYLWRLDYAYKYTHQGAPWLTKMPSEYFHDSMYISTYQFERSPSRESIAAVLSTAPWLKSKLVYTSGYPNRDSMTSDEVASRLPSDWHEGVFHNNADAFFRWPSTNARTMDGSDLNGTL